MTRIIKSTMIVLLFLCCFFSFAQEKETIENLSSRVKILEGQKEYIEKRTNDMTDLINQRFNLKSSEIDQKFAPDLKIINSRLEDVESEIIKSTTFIYWFLGLLFVNSAVFLALYRLFKKKINSETEKSIEDAKKHFEKWVEEKIASDFESEESNLLKFIGASEELELKKNSAILVLSPEKSDSSFVENFFKSMRFPNVKFQGTDEEINFKDLDLIFFNDEDGNFDEGLILDFIAKSEGKTIGFYFGSERIPMTEAIKNRVTFANAPMQIYGNLINALRYQMLLKN